MVDCDQLSGFKLTSYPDKVLVMLSGQDVQHYYRILREAFDQYRFSSLFPSRYRQNYWGTYIYRVNQDDLEKLDDLLTLMEEAVYIDDALSQTFALDYHWQPREGRTEIGELVYQSKPYGRRPTEHHRQNACELCEYFEEFIRQHPTYLDSDYIVPVPSAASKPFDLPQFIAQTLSQKLEIPSGQSHIKKVKQTQPMKDLHTTEKKLENIRDAFAVDENHPFKDAQVLIIDDIYASGMTLHELAVTLEEAGAEVIGLVATKTYNDV